MRALHVNHEKAKEILRPDRNVITLDHHIWPNLSTDQWIRVEKDLKDLIIIDYGKRNNVNIASLTQSEIKDIILGMDIANHKNANLLNQQMNEINDNNNTKNKTGTLTKTHNIHGEVIKAITFTPYEQQKILSKKDWREKAVSASNLHLRTKHIYVNSENVIKESACSFVLPKNILKKFIIISDLNFQIGGFLYGKTSIDNPFVKEIHCIVMTPQLGTASNVNLPINIPDHSYLKDLEPLGWIYTQPKLVPLSPSACSYHAKMLIDNPTWDVESCVAISCSFTQGSCTLTASKLTPQGLDWGRSNSNADLSVDSSGYSSLCFENSQVFLSDKYSGFFMVPDNEIWNYNFIGVSFNKEMNYNVILANPKDFYHEIHRPTHFLSFGGNTNKNMLNEEEVNKDLFK